MDRSVLWRAAAVQALSVAVLSVALALALPDSFFDDWGWLAWPAAWLLCALVTAAVRHLPTIRVLAGAARGPLRSDRQRRLHERARADRQPDAVQRPPRVDDHRVQDARPRDRGRRRDAQHAPARPDRDRAGVLAERLTGGGGGGGGARGARRADGPAGGDGRRGGVLLLGGRGLRDGRDAGRRRRPHPLDLSGPVGRCRRGPPSRRPRIERGPPWSSGQDAAL